MIGYTYLLTTTVDTFRDLAIVRETSVLETGQIVLGRGGPTLTECRSLWLRGVVEADHILAVQLTLKANQAHNIADRFLLCHESVLFFERAIGCD